MNLKKSRMFISMGQNQNMSNKSDVRVFEKNSTGINKKIAVIGGGPAGVFAAIFASENPDNSVFIFEKNNVLKTLLPTGGGRCNLAHNEHDSKELAKSYPRGEKFLYSVFSQFCTKDTIDFFNKIGIKTYVQPDSRIFPVCDSSQEVRNALLRELDCINTKHERVLSVSKEGDVFKVKTQKTVYDFDKIVVTTGGKGIGHQIAEELGHNIIPLKPALTSLKIKEKFLSELSGLSLQNISAKIIGAKQKAICGDLLFTHYGISGPLTYKISSYFAYEEFNNDKPLKISFNLINKRFEEFDKEFNEELKARAQKDISNLLCEYIPKRLSDLILQKEKINPQTKSGQLSKSERIKLSKNLTEFELNAICAAKGEEIVTAGGVDLKEVNPKTMESKIVQNLFFCGEILDIDGLTGGFNLQNCWSTGFVAGSNI